MMETELMIMPVIMCGGSGTRMWPQSREHYPKQFLNLVEADLSLLQSTVQRLPSNCSPAIAITNEQHRFLVAEQLREIDYHPQSIVLEPEGRNTAPAVAIAAFMALEKGQDATLLIMASDHFIENNIAFHQCIENGFKLANQNKLVTFGIVPSSPETGYGYIKKGISTGINAFNIEQFVEKPDLVTAQQYVSSGDYLWNSGMFMFKASLYLAELEKYRPDIYQACLEASQNNQNDLDFTRLDHDAFCACPSESIDYAVMEKTNLGVTVPLDAGWCDVGSWSALWELLPKDKNNNYLRGDIISEQTYDCYINGKNRLIATLGLENFIIVDTDDALLIANKDKVQDIKKIVAELNKANRPESINHRKIYRPWGSYDSIDEGTRFQVKRITLKPGKKMTTQMHHHRAEHWIVVSGTARVVKNDVEELLTENQSTYIPIGVKHSLENPGQLPLEVIEVQSGQLFGDQDIIRFND
ncbi:mannose-1-phosphate guanylyltransferase/mannose-6-phosphate isomerase [Neptunicella marina]|uniref:mannose-1-phosphate guanylyltransferase n=2 Tax=Neptunicella marina TaxID=2125989 RepID=A0A8J6IUC6_9ALTE|nr:mannose-1-phosphate guanylyltransferase/mannose-6-phosphate isomerase [Neptunicella marina]